MSISSGGILTLNTVADYETKISYDFTVTASDAVGNTATTPIFTIPVNDDGKVFICHVTGRGTGGKTNTIEVSPNSVTYQAHLGHGDSLGACDSDVDYILPEITSGIIGSNLDENSGAGQTIYTITATDNVAVTSYAIGGIDVSLLSVNSSTGVVSLDTDPDYEIKSSYSFTVTASDAAGNTSDPTTVTFLINDLDEIPPIITVLGDNPATVEMGSTYTDAGATADGGETVTPSGTVETSTVGTYTITYSATDAEGNTGTATRTVTVVDTTAPIITVLGDNPATVEMGSTYTDAGATADGGETVTPSGTVETSTVGTYTITYSATDAEGNTGTATRTVTVVDTTAPIITVLGDNPATVEMGSTYTDAGATADGGETVTPSGTVETSTVGTYTITYSATDAKQTQEQQQERLLL